MTPYRHAHRIQPLTAGLIDWEEKNRSLKDAPVTGPGSAPKEVWLDGRDHLGGMEVHLTWGVHRTLGEWHARRRAHRHPYPECLFFVGLNTANVNYLGAEVEISLGGEREVHAFNEPTVVVIPAGMPHGPITTRRVYSPRGFGFLAVGLQATREVTWLEEGENGAEPPAPEGGPDGGGKYGRLVKSLKTGLVTERGRPVTARFTPEELAARAEFQKRTGFKPGPGSPDHMAWMYGRDLENLDLNVAWGFSSGAGISQRGVGAHSHPEDEILVYLGMDPDHPDDLGAEIEIDLGKEHERHSFRRSTVIACPAGMPHGPIVTRWVDRPFAFLLVNLARDVSMSFE